MSTKVNNCCSIELLKPPRENKRRSHQTGPWSATSWRPVQTKRCPRPWRRRRRRCWRGSKRKFRSESSSRRSFHFFSVGPFSFLDRCHLCKVGSLLLTKFQSKPCSAIENNCLWGCSSCCCCCCHLKKHEEKRRKTSFLNLFFLLWYGLMFECHDIGSLWAFRCCSCRRRWRWRRWRRRCCCCCFFVLEASQRISFLSSLTWKRIKGKNYRPGLIDL